MTQQPLGEYFAALERIKTGRPEIVPKGIRITNDAVALEAGRGKGSIKKSREVFADLIRAIEHSAIEQIKPKNEQKERMNRVKSTADQLRRDLEASLAREISLLHELYMTKKELAKLTGGKVLPIRGK
jgi:DNA primase large subunit